MVTSKSKYTTTHGLSIETNCAHSGIERMVRPRTKPKGLCWSNQSYVPHSWLPDWLLSLLVCSLLFPSPSLSLVGSGGLCSSVPGCWSWGRAFQDAAQSQKPEAEPAASQDSGFRPWSGKVVVDKVGPHIKTILYYTILTHPSLGSWFSIKITLQDDKNYRPVKLIW